MKTTAGKVFETFLPFMSNCSPFTSIDWFYGLRARICGDCQVVEKTAVSISHYVAK